MSKIVSRNKRNLIRKENILLLTKIWSNKRKKKYMFFKTIGDLILLTWRGGA